MPLSQLLLEALNLMVVGMLCVGLFLGALVFIIPLLNKIVPDEPAPEQPVETTNQSLEQSTVVAVISAAIQQYRNQHK